MTGPAISVVIAAYDAAGTLGEQLAALARHRPPFEFEVLVCDNGSTDATADVATSWADRLPVRVVDASARRGAAAARNIGVGAARAPLLAFCDADDVVAEDWLVAAHDALLTDEVVALGARFRAAHSTRSRPEHSLVTTHTVPFLPQLPIVGAGHLAIRTGLFRAMGGFDETFRTGEDVDLSWRLQLAGHRPVPHPEAVVDVRERSGVRAVFRQARARALGDLQLQHRYANVIRALAPVPSSQTPVTAPSPAATPGTTVSPGAAAGRVRASAVRVLRSLRTPADAAQLVERTWSRASVRLATAAGTAWARRFGRVDRSRPPLDASVADAYLRGVATPD